MPPEPVHCGWNQRNEEDRLRNSEQHSKVQVEFPDRADVAGEQHPEQKHRGANGHGFARSKSVTEPARKRRSQRSNHAGNRIRERDAALAPLKCLLKRLNEHPERHAYRSAHHLHHGYDRDDNPDVVRIDDAPVVRAHAACGLLRLSCHIFVLRSSMQRTGEQEHFLPRLTLSGIAVCLTAARSALT